MKKTEPPTSGARLLKRLVPAEDHDVLLGDLHEEYQNGRSRVWYWFQIAAAIAASSWKDIRKHKLAALGAGALALAYVLIVSPALVQGTIKLSWRLRISVVTAVAIFKAMDLAISAVLGWRIVRLARSRCVTMVVVYCTVMLTAVCLLILASAIMVSVFHPVEISGTNFAVQVQSALTHQLVQALLMFCAGFLATRRPEAA